MAHLYLVSLQLLLCVLVASMISLIRKRQTEYATNLWLFEAAFWIYSLNRLSEIFSTVFPDYSGLLSYIEHYFGVIFFLLVGSLGVLNFTYVNQREEIEKGYRILIFVLTTVFILYFALFDWQANILNAAILSHLFELGVFIVVTGFIIKRLREIGSPFNPTYIYRRYPFGVAIVLWMISVILHIFVLVGSGGEVFENILNVFSLGAIFIIFIRIKSIYSGWGSIPKEFEVFGGREGLIDTLNHILRHIYYGPIDLGVGEKEVLLNEFFKLTNLAEVVDIRKMEIKPSKFQAKLFSEKDFSTKIIKGLLAFFTRHPELIKEFLVYNLIQAIVLNKKISSTPQQVSLTLWDGLSTILRELGEIPEDMIALLKEWSPSENYAYFEKRHPSGNSQLDALTGLIPSRGIILNIKSTKIDKKWIALPLIKENVSQWRNIIYISSDPLNKIFLELGGLKDYIKENRIKIIAIGLKGSEYPVEDNIFQIRESPKDLLFVLKDCIRGFPLSSIIVVADLNPVLSINDTEQVRMFFKELNELLYEDKACLFGIASEVVNPVNLDIAREFAIMVINHEMSEKGIVSTVEKSDLKMVPKETFALEPALTELLVYIDKQNTQGRKPTFSDVEKAFSITGVTARKRINKLVNEGLVKVERSGRYKVLEVGEKGRQFLIQITT